MTAITLQEAAAKLPELLAHLQPGEEIVIVDQGKPLAHVRKAERATWPCQAGTAKDAILSIAPDFDAPLEAFKEYME